MDTLLGTLEKSSSSIVCQIEVVGIPGSEAVHKSRYALLTSLGQHEVKMVWHKYERKYVNERLSFVYD